MLSPGVRIVSGASATDTIGTVLGSPVSVEVRGTDGRPASGVIVSFDAAPPIDSSSGTVALWVCPTSPAVCADVDPPQPFQRRVLDTTDAAGRAAVRARLGRVAGRAVLQIRVLDLGLQDSAVFTVRPGAVFGVRAAAADTAVSIGRTRMLAGTVVDRFGNARAERTTISAAAGTALTVDGASGAVTGVEMGLQWIHTRFQGFVDSTLVRVVPPGRLAVWTTRTNSVLLVDTDGGNVRNVVTGVNGGLGAFPRFDALRQRLSVMTSALVTATTPASNAIIDVDTLASRRRDVRSSVGLSSISVTRLLPDGALLAVGIRTVDQVPSPLALWRIDGDTTVAQVAVLPSAIDRLGAVDISPDGSRIAYLASTGFFQPNALRVLTLSTGQSVSVATAANSPRWSPSGERIAYLAAGGVNQVNPLDGIAAVVNADGTGRRTYTNGDLFSPGLSWSHDATYLVGRSSSGPRGLRVIRLGDGATILLAYRDRTASTIDYFQPDWR